MLDDDAIIVEELGTEDWVLRSFTFADGGKTKIGRTLGRSLGWGVSASIGVKLARPDQQVVALQGDGGFLFGQSDALWSTPTTSARFRPARARIVTAPARTSSC